MGKIVGPEMENFRTGSGKICHRKAYKKLFRESYSRFLIPPTMTAVDAFEVLSAVMTSSPEVVRIKKILIDFGVLRPTEFSSEVCFPLVSRASARLATMDGFNNSKITKTSNSHVTAILY